ncbi:GntR family transcriptional regulator [Variovorax sp. WS11]|uniref:GntR family transcriptional regulator n=1 Tax=Variovorax sp. WS11 TaxID=1105204 RepID=UPI000D0CA91C|nr:GntR family transcriptional regulator [Variovorax sp. WS11]NDZ18323.1 GntR family transcriptional regulator [Variovorax sp. WS11]PSL84352.1 GntR family transcriptional regulator [Variovorax sp. WS11]
MAADSTNGELVLSADSVTTALRDMILTGSLGIGVQLRQEALAKRFGVSRIPVREALKRLQAEGLVQHTPHQGSIVASQSIPELLETLDIRIGLETRALKLAIPLMKASDHKAAREIMARYDASDSPLEWTELNLEFHLCLYRPCGRPRLLKMIEEIVRGIGIHLRAQQSYKAGRKSPQSEHREILKACVARDVPLAIELLEKHIEHTQSALQDD